MSEQQDGLITAVSLGKVSEPFVTSQWGEISSLFFRKGWTLVGAVVRSLTGLKKKTTFQFSSIDASNLNQCFLWKRTIPRFLH